MTTFDVVLVPFSFADLRSTKRRPLRIYNLKEHFPKHYVDIGLIADWKFGEPEVAKSVHQNTRLH